MTRWMPINGGSFAYFVQAKNGGPIKLGYALDPEARLRELQVGNPQQLVIRRLIPGGHGTEFALHHHFAKARLRGEWFKPTAELVALMRSDEMPDWLYRSGAILEDDFRCDVCATVLSDDEQGQCSACIEAAPFRT